VTYQDKNIQCADCGATFQFTAGEQEFFASKGYTNEPKRCTNCRQSRRSNKYGETGGAGAGPRQMYPQFVANVGKRHRFLSNPARASRFIAASATAK